MTRVSRVCVVVCCASVCLGLLATRRPGTSARATQVGGALVLDGEANPDATLPSVGRLVGSPEAVAGDYRAQGYVVESDPTGRCLAVGTPIPLDEEAVQKGGLNVIGLAAYILHHTSSEQLGLRQKGYLPMEALSEVQRKATLGMGRRGGWVGRDGQLTIPGSGLSVGIWQTWDLQVCAHVEDEFVRQRLLNRWRPPTPEAIAAPPLAGSPLWWAWPHAEASWGNETLSIAAGRYTLDDILTRLSQASGLAFTAPAEERVRRVAAVAESVPVRSLVWALEIARGLRTRIVPAEGDGKMRIELWPQMGRANDRDGLQPIARGAYYSPRLSPVGAELLPRLGELPPDSYWVGWRYSDLPMLYQDLVADGWQVSFRLHQNADAPPLDPDHTFVLWTKAVLVSLCAASGQGGGASAEFCLPAL
jgi:hypothetical protein